ncbi:unnamed protein product [Prunus armeniaca]
MPPYLIAIAVNCFGVPAGGCYLLFATAGKIGIFSNKRAQGCSHPIRPFKAKEEAGEAPEILLLCCDVTYWSCCMSSSFDWFFFVPTSSSFSLQSSSSCLSLIRCSHGHDLLDVAHTKDLTSILELTVPAGWKANAKEADKVVNQLQSTAISSGGERAASSSDSESAFSVADWTALQRRMIVTTPEKWDVIIRKSSDMSLSMSVKLLIIYEVHLLNDDRGPVIEALVVRTWRQLQLMLMKVGEVESTQTMIRIVGLSATLPNYLEVAQFLRVNPEAGLFFFDSSYRPVPLAQQYIGISEQNFTARIELQNEICYKKTRLSGNGIRSFSKGHNKNS